MVCLCCGSCDHYDVTSCYNLTFAPQEADSSPSISLLHIKCGQRSADDPEENNTVQLYTSFILVKLYHHYDHSHKHTVVKHTVCLCDLQTSIHPTGNTRLKMTNASSCTFPVGDAGVFISSAPRLVKENSSFTSNYPPLPGTHCK